MAKTATKKFTVDDAAAEVVAAFEKFIQTLAGSNGVSAASAPAEVEEDDEDVEEVEAEALDREEVEGLKIGELRALAKEYLGDDAPTKKADILAALEEFYDEEDSDEDEDEDDEEADEVEEDDEADEEEDDEEEGEYTREFLEELDLKELRKIAKDEGHSASDYRGMDQDALVDLILGESEDEDEDEDDEDDEDVEELDEDALKAMTEKELTALAKELSIKVPAKVKSLKGAKLKKALVDLILDSGEEE